MGVVTLVGFVYLVVDMLTIGKKAQEDEAQAEAA